MLKRIFYKNLAKVLKRALYFEQCENVFGRDMLQESLSHLYQSIDEIYHHYNGTNLKPIKSEAKEILEGKRVTMTAPSHYYKSFTKISEWASSSEPFSELRLQLNYDEEGYFILELLKVYMEMTAARSHSHEENVCIFSNIKKEFEEILETAECNKSIRNLPYNKTKIDTMFRGFRANANLLLLLRDGKDESDSLEIARHNINASYFHRVYTCTNEEQTEFFRSIIIEFI